MLLDWMEQECSSEDTTIGNHSLTPSSGGFYSLDTSRGLLDVAFLFAGGIGTQEEPFQIQTEEQLRAFAVSLTENMDYRGLYIQLDHDIQLTGGDWIPVGEGEYAFNGHFDGQYHTISGLKIGTAEMPHQDSVGLGANFYFGFFGVLEEHAEVRNLQLAVEFYVVGGQSLYVAGLAGYISQALVEQVHVTGVIEGRTTHQEANIFVGGIGGNTYRQQILRCSSNACVRAESVGGMAEAGGIVGMQNRGVISNCRSSGSISGATAGIAAKNGPALGGIAGVHAGTIVNCAATAAVIADCQATYIGALAGWATGISDTVESCYCLDTPLVVDSFSENRQQIQPAIAIGWSVGRGINRVGEAYAGSVMLNVRGIVAESMPQDTLDFYFAEISKSS